MKRQDVQTPRATRREFVSLVAAAALAGLPRPAIGGGGARGRVGSSEKIALGCIGVGAQGTRVMMDFLKMKDVEVVAVCDVNRESSDYSEWGHGELVGKERRLLSDSGWGVDWKGPTCGREPARRLVDAYYRKERSSSGHAGCGAYNDFREMLDKEKKLDAVVVCTPNTQASGCSGCALGHRRGALLTDRSPLSRDAGASGKGVGVKGRPAGP